MKTIYLFARIEGSGPRLTHKRRSESLVPHRNEMPIATLFDQPDNYWEMVEALGDDVLNDKPNL